MLALAEKYEALLRAAGIDPEEVTDMELVKTSSEKLGCLKVKVQPKVQFIDIEIIRKETP